MILGKKIKEARLKLGLTQEELGNLINVTKTSVCCYENGTRNPNVETLQDLCNVLNLPISALFSGEFHVRDSVKLYNSDETKFMYELRKNGRLHTYVTQNNPKKVVEELEKIIEK